MIVRAPDILDSIMIDASASPRHRVDAIKTLDSFTTNPQEGAAAADRFVINMVIDGQVEHYDKPRAVCIDDGESNVGTAAPQRALPAANKWDGGDAAAAPPGKNPAKMPAKTPIEHESVSVVEHESDVYEPDVHELVRAVEALSAAQREALEAFMKMGD